METEILDEKVVASFAGLKPKIVPMKNAHRKKISADEQRAVVATTSSSRQQNQVQVDFKISSIIETRVFLLYLVIIMQSIIFVTEIIFNNFLHSLLIQTDAYHHLFNAGNAILMAVCYKISDQITLKNTFGWVRTELLGMLIVGSFIVALIFSLLIEGFLQLFHLHEISKPTDFSVLLSFGIWSLLTNVLYVLIINGVITNQKYKQTTRGERSFSTANCQNKNKKKSSYTVEEKFSQPEASSKIEEIFDRQTSNSPFPENVPETNRFWPSLTQGIISPVLVILASFMIHWFKDWNFVEMIDPLTGVIASIVLCIQFMPQLKNTVLILMQTIPENVNIVRLKREMLDTFDKIQDIHEFHIWRLTGSKIVATCHLVLIPQSTIEYQRLFEEIKTFLHSQYGIAYITIQPEFSSNTPTKQTRSLTTNSMNYCINQVCLMKCPKKSGQKNCANWVQCNQKTCCIQEVDNDEEMDKKSSKSKTNVC